MTTKNGIVKKTALQEYGNPGGRGIIAVTLDEGDELISVKRTSERTISSSGRDGALWRGSTKTK
ncbi:MAG: hypothetical protein MZV70_59225 [Desulfobacterales bacterium]|nr:hypothetical protein [Desulfobacterales bacterium]